MAQSSLLTSVKFIVKCDTIWKDDLFIVGNYPELGQWQSQRAVPLMTTGEKFTQWESPVLHLDMKRRQSALEYKYILRRGHQFMEWEEGFMGNRFVSKEDLRKYSWLAMDDGWYGSKVYPPNIYDSRLREWKLGRRVGHEEDGYWGKGYEQIADQSSMIKTIYALNNESGPLPSHKLRANRDLLSGYAQSMSNEDLALFGCYTELQKEGEVFTQEGEGMEGGLRLADCPLPCSQMHTDLDTAQTPQNAFYIRTVKKCYAPLQQAAKEGGLEGVPLSRLRKIVQTGDYVIPTAKKNRELKAELNKLHTAPAITDLFIAETIHIGLIQGNAQEDLVQDYELFKEELWVYFNSSLEQMLVKLKKDLPSMPSQDMIGAEVSDTISALHNLKSKDGNPILTAIYEVGRMREEIIDLVIAKLRELHMRVEYEHADHTEMQLEEYLFVLLMKYLEKYQAPKPRSDAEVRELLQLLLLILRQLQLSHFQEEECNILLNQLKGFILETENKKLDKFSYLRLKATLERINNLISNFSSTLNGFQDKIVALGMTMNIKYELVRKYLEGLLGKDTLVPLAKIVSLLMAYTKGNLHLAPYSPLQGGIGYGKIVQVSCLSEIQIKHYNSPSKSLIVFCDSMSGDECLPDQISGLIVAHPVPQFSHVVMGIKQKRIPCAYYTALMAYNLELKKYPIGETMKMLFQVDGLKASNWLFDKHSVANIVSPIKGKQDYYPYMEECKVTEDEDDEADLAGEKPPLDFHSKSLLNSDMVNPTNVGVKGVTSVSLYQLSKGSSKTGHEFYCPGSFYVPFGVFHQVKVSNQVQPAILLLNSTPFEECVKPLNKLQMQISQTFKLGEHEKCLSTIISEVQSKMKGVKKLAIRGSTNDLSGVGEGIYKVSIADVDNPRSIKEGMGRVYRSLYSLPVVLSRGQRGLGQMHPEMALIIQEMLDIQRWFRLTMPTHNEIEIEIGQGVMRPSEEVLREANAYRMTYIKAKKEVIMGDLASITHAFQVAPQGSKSTLTSQRIDYSIAKLSQAPETDLIPLAKKLGEVGSFLQTKMNAPLTITGGLMGNKVAIFQAFPMN